MAKVLKDSRFILVSFIILVLNISISYSQQNPPPRIRHPNRGGNRVRPTLRPNARVHPCEQSSCYPATGNLLIGRENRLSASSTCGLDDPERFCIVSHLEEKKCFLCDTRRETEEDPQLNHRVGNIIYKYKQRTFDPTWWQSENGKENVTVQLDLEAEFHFTHLIIYFATFRPAAMLIERSYDFGKTWHVYRYFAANCAESFPGVLMEPESVTDVVCDQRYSSVEPSKNGEVIFKVLPPNMNIENPYADHIQNMLKMTNLRINFTRLHSLGDTLLDDRSEIQEKYYYAISNMVVRGSCSCYGHASRCLPLEGFDTQNDMVHGRCECTHNTKGLNCEHCEDFFNDLPWKPALGKQTNACKKCDCNNHALSCHFDQAVYEHSGKVSGGVCDNCEHNTQGQHCEQCKPFFYRDPAESIQSPYACLPCDCDPIGALDDGICDSVSDPETNSEPGSCHCKKHVKGRRCDVCREGYWNLTESNIEGCQECSCNLLGTVDNQGCNLYTGECTCKRHVMGRDCNQCMPETYGLSESEYGCNLCDCDPGGSLDNNCDVVTGQCKCRSHMQGRRCDEPNQNHFIPSVVVIHEAEGSNANCEGTSSYGNCTIVVREPYPDRPATWTGPGFVKIGEGGDIIFTIDDVPKTMNYDVQLRYLPQVKGSWEDVRVSLVRPDQIDIDSGCYNTNPLDEQERSLRLDEYDTKALALNDLCLEQGKTYKFIVSFHRQSPYEANPKSQILIDSLALIPRIEVTSIFTGSSPAEIRLRDFQYYRCNDSFYEVNHLGADKRCEELLSMAGTLIHDGATPCDCNPTGSFSKKCDEHGGFCKCKPNVVGRQCDKCAPGTYGFSPNGCTSCDCDSVGSKDNDCDLITGQCNCHPNTYGRECNQCQPGYWNFPDCQQCNCNGHTPTCDSKTGECLSCQDYTTGYNCDRCVEGYYGDPLLGSEIGCRPCRCPDTIASGHSYADQCSLIPSSNDVICYCNEGYAGTKCDVCGNNYFGNPSQPGGSCEKCNCNNNVDLNREGNCDGRNGNCLQCLYETSGDNCEHCRDGFYGDALQQDCRRCECDVLGTNSTIKHCNRSTGQCPCLPNVVGTRCDECKENHWKIASGEGCEPCACDEIGSLSDQCNPYDGQCECRQGFGGRACDQCETNFWGDPNVKCEACNCDHFGSASFQCDRETGQCVCIKGIGGHKCDMCARGYLGQAPYCDPCGECFDNWDDILKNLDKQTDDIIDRAKLIKLQGATGAYTKEFEDVEKKIDDIRTILQNTTVSMKDIQKINDNIEKLRAKLVDSENHLKETDAKLDALHEELSLASVELTNLGETSQKIKSLANELKENATQLQEANVEGALNLTRDAWSKVQSLSNIYNEASELNTEADRQCKRIEALISKQIENEGVLIANDKQIDELQAALDKLTEEIPELNEQVCDKRGDPCDSLCGGAGCNKCGGISCERGALTRAESALNYAKDTEKTIKDKDQQADDLIRAVSHAKTEALDAHKKAKDTFEKVQANHNATEELIATSRDLITTLTNAVSNNTASPKEIQTIAEDILKLDLELDPDEIKLLANNIDETVYKLENVDRIIENTRADLELVEALRKNATDAELRANEVLKRATEVSKALEEAEQAQKAAREAISKADDDILTAKADLIDIDSETRDAKSSADETEKAVKDLQDKLNNLQKKLLKNQHDAKEIKVQSDAVKESAGNTHENAKGLKKNYKKANETLTLKSASSEVARERAQQLLQRASRITVDTNAKLKELKEMTLSASSGDNELNTLEQRVVQLNGEIDTYINRIRESSERYRQCTS